MPARMWMEMTTCFLQAPAWNSSWPRLRVCRGSNPQPPAFLQVVSVPLLVLKPQQPIHMGAFMLRFFHPVGEDPLRVASLPQPIWASHLVYPSLRIGYECSSTSLSETSLNTMPSLVITPFPCSLSQNRPLGGIGLINKFIKKSSHLNLNSWGSRAAL